MAASDIATDEAVQGVCDGDPRFGRGRGAAAASADAVGHHFRDNVINSIFIYIFKDQQPIKLLVQPK